MSSEAPPLPQILTRRCTPDHPPYALMVRSAIQDLGEIDGSTESSISDYIVSNYHSLPWGHSKLLPYYLNKLLIAGEIIIKTSSSYPIHYGLPSPNPNPPPRRRGRGRPRRLTAAPAPSQQNPKPNPQPQSASDFGVQVENEKPRVILKFKWRKDQILQGEAFSGGWVCSRQEACESDQAAAMQAQVESREEQAAEATAAATMAVEEEENQYKKKMKSSKKPKRLWYER